MSDSLNDLFDATFDEVTGAVDAPVTDPVDAEAHDDAPAAPTSAKQARAYAKKALKKAAKLHILANEAQARAEAFEALALTLPESAPGASSAPKVRKARPVLPVGTEVKFRFGRTTRTTQARIVEGTIRAQKFDAAGIIEAYKVSVGEGFDEELFTVHPGSILVEGESLADNEASNEEGAA